MITLIFETHYNNYCELSDEDSAKVKQYAKEHEIGIMYAAQILEGLGEISFDFTAEPDNWDTDLVSYEED